MSIEYACALPDPIPPEWAEGVHQRVLSDGRWLLEGRESKSGACHYRQAARARRAQWPEDVSIYVQPSRILVAFHALNRDEILEFLRLMDDALRSLGQIDRRFEEL
jgi:hypothetical protein